MTQPRLFLLPPLFTLKVGAGDAAPAPCATHDLLCLANEGVVGYRNCPQHPFTVT